MLIIAIVTGHGRDSKGEDHINWQALAQGIDTIAFYMGVGNLSHICERLIKYGRESTTPVAIIQWGTTDQQKTVVGTLADIEDKLKVHSITHPAIVLVGQVVGLREKLKWYKKELS